MEKKHRVIMLPTKKANPNLFIHQGLGSNVKVLSSDQGIAHHKEMMACGVSKPQHLYIISDEEIKEGDWFTFEKSNVIERATVISDDGKVKILNSQIAGLGKAYKAIASTDKSLCEKKHWRGYEHIHTNYPIPQIRESFVKKYVETYNAGKPIEYVNLEYESVYQPYYENNEFHKNAEKEVLKLRPDNTVIIHSVKDTFTREETSRIVWSAMEQGSLNKENRIPNNSEEWFNENY